MRTRHLHDVVPEVPVLRPRIDLRWNPGRVQRDVATVSTALKVLSIFIVSTLNVHGIDFTARGLAVIPSGFKTRINSHQLIQQLVSFVH